MLTTLLVGLLLSAPQADASLQSQYQEVRASLADGDAEAAQERLLEIYEQSEGDPEFLRHLDSFNDAMVESLFLLDQQAKGFVEGSAEANLPFKATVLSYKEKSSQYKLRWEGEDQLTDMVFVGEELRFPFPVDKKFRVGVELSAYPSRSQVKVLAELPDGSRFEIDCGLAGEGMLGQVARAYYTEPGGRPEALGRGEKKLPAGEKPILLSLKGAGNSLQMLNGKRKYFGFKAPKGVPGLTGTLVFQGIDPETVVAVEFDGKLEREKFLGLVEAKHQRQREAFQSTLDLREFLPAWVHPHLVVSVWDMLELQNLPGESPSGMELQAWLQAREVVTDSRVRMYPLEGLGTITNSPPQGMSSLLVDYAAMLIAFEGGYWDYASGHAYNVLKVDPTHLPTQLIQLEAMAREGRGDDAWLYAKRYFQADPTRQEPILKTVMVLLRLDMVDDLRFFLEAEKSIPEELKEACLRFARLREAPELEMKEFRRGRVYLYSDLPKSEAEKWAGFVFKEVARAERFLPDGTLDEDDAIRIHLFSERWDYDAYSHVVADQARPSPAGFFSPEYDTVIAWKHDSDTLLEQSLRLETMLQIGKRIHHEYPVWASIGLAEIVKDRTMPPDWDVKELSPMTNEHLRRLSGTPPMPISRFFHLGGSALWHAVDAEKVESMAWALTVTLMASKEDLGLDIVGGMVESLRSGNTWVATADVLFDQLEGNRAIDYLYKAALEFFARL